MPTYDASQAQCLVFTYKEGLLSAIAHDLKIRVNKFQVEVDRDNEDLTATFDANSLEVVNAMENGQEAPGKLGDKDKRTIEGNIVNDVLHSKKFGEIRFSLDAHREAGDGYQVKGDLTLHGTTKSIVADVKRQGDSWVAEAIIHQPDFGIKPYSAMLGTLKIKPDLKVQLTIPAV